jgi:glutamate/tyrosine decarboxylase-like PLP-dependent enzyme
MDLIRWLAEAVSSHEVWASQYGEFNQHPAMAIDDERVEYAFAEFNERLKRNYPFFHPSYAGQMLKPPHPLAILGYLRAMLINPNNHALDGGPATADMEREIVAELAAMFGFETHLGHLTTSGTIANLEALFVARQTHPDKAIAYSVDSHYTHARMCGVLRVEGHALPVDGLGRMDLDALDSVLSGGEVGTVVVTAGSTGLGAVDSIQDIVPMARRYGARVHVDAAYGGFFSLLATGDEAGLVEPEPWRAIAECDSVVIDPHKHGLQPYGCGAVLFRDPAVGRFYLHDSPYTYFTSDSLHLGEISLECSRAGASAAALWLTLRLLPLTSGGLGAILAAGRRAALRWTDMIQESEVLRIYQPPQLDIVTYFPANPGSTMADIDMASVKVLTDGMSATADPVFLSVLKVSSEAFGRRHGGVVADCDGARILRSVLMKPESETYLERLHRRVEDLAHTAVSQDHTSGRPRC